MTFRQEKNFFMPKRRVLSWFCSWFLQTGPNQFVVLWNFVEKR